ncbi:MAG: NAD(P)/FAD-dependent oxidoreductase, partial [Gammaproteobacteria bacterium]
MESLYEAIIVGGGPAGASTAILLAQAGWSVALVEKQRFPRRKVCGECIAATNLPLLDTLGVSEAFADLAGPELRRVGLFAGERILTADLPRFGDGPYT